MQTDRVVMDRVFSGGLQILSCLKVGLVQRHRAAVSRSYHRRGGVPSNKSDGTPPCRSATRWFNATRATSRTRAKTTTKQTHSRSNAMTDAAVTIGIHRWREAAAKMK